MTEWSTINIPVSCLEKDGLNKNKIQVRGLFLSENGVNFDLNSIVIKDGKATGKEVSCLMFLFIWIVEILKLCVNL